MDVHKATFTLCSMADYEKTPGNSQTIPADYLLVVKYVNRLKQRYGESGFPVTAILQAYSICQNQPDPGLSDDNNYLKNSIAEAEHVDFRDGLEKQSVVAGNGSDITAIVEKAVAWLTEHSF